jgi:Golgi nucleoside diphosphatase
MWRDHLLSFNMTDENISGSFVFLYPFDNEECKAGVTSYQTFLVSDNEEETKFYPRDLAVFIRTLNELHNTDWTRQLVERYLGE